MNRAYLLSIVITTLGLWGVTTSLRHLGRALRFRLSPGKPYMAGTIQRSLTTLLVTLLLALSGASLGAARWLARDYQHVEDTSRAARMRVDGKGTLTLQVKADASHPGHPSFAAGLQGESWQIRGVLITFPPWTRHLGLGAFHRITGAGSPGAPPDAMPPGTRRIRQVAAALPAIMGVRAEARFLLGQGQIPIWTSVMVNRQGYVLGGADGGDAIAP